MHCPNNYALSHDSFGPTLSFTVTNREQSAVYLINSSERKFKGASAKRHKQNAAELPSRSRRCEGRNAEPGPVRTERAANPGLPGTGRCETRVERGCSAGTGTTAAVSGERQRGTAAPARRRRNHAGSAEPRFGSPVTNPGRGASSAGPVPPPYPRRRRGKLQRPRSAAAGGGRTGSSRPTRRGEAGKGLRYLQQVQAPAEAARGADPRRGGGSRQPGAGGGAGRRRSGSPPAAAPAPGGPRRRLAGVSAEAAAAAATSEREGREGGKEGGERDRKREGGREGGEAAREQREAPREGSIDRHMAVAIRRRPPTAEAYGGEPEKSCEEGTHL